MTVSEFDLIIRFMGGFAAGLVGMSIIMLRYMRLEPDVQEFIKSMGLGVGLCLFGIFLIFWVLNHN